MITFITFCISQQITTPKKAKYHLRNRVIVGSASMSNTPSLDDSIPFEKNDDIFQESQPDQMMEQAHQAVMDEMKILQVTDIKYWISCNYCRYNCMVVHEVTSIASSFITCYKHILTMFFIYEKYNLIIDYLQFDLYQQNKQLHPSSTH